MEQHRWTAKRGRRQAAGGRKGESLSAWWSGVRKGGGTAVFPKWMAARWKGLRRLVKTSYKQLSRKDRRKKQLLGAVGAALVVLLFCGPSWRDALSLPPVSRLRDNLDCIGAIIERYPWLVASLLVLVPLLFLRRAYRFHFTTFTLLGIEFEFQQPESEAVAQIMAQIKNFLSAKRAVFVFYEEYDNYYDCINSMYKTLVFLQEQLENFERLSQTNTDSYEHIEGMIQEIGRFLTKYQSDYRRYYETEIERMSLSGMSFVSFHEIQDLYDKNREMAADFYRLNEHMARYAKFFDIDIEKWKWPEWDDLEERRPAPVKAAPVSVEAAPVPEKGTDQPIAAEPAEQAEEPAEQFPAGEPTEQFPTEEPADREEEPTEQPTAEEGAV